jgi:predicted HAD superfamily hydrolase
MTAPAGLHKLIEQAEWLSLDIFDTAVLRAVPRPVDVFEVVNARFEPQALGFAYPQARIAAEAKAREEVWRSLGRVEIVLDEIYAILKREHPSSGAIVKELQAAELAAELALALRNPFIHAAYRHALNSGKPVIFASDMYLPETVVRQILDIGGYSDYERLYLSSTLGMTKAAGTLYERIIAETPCRPAAILHIGDNEQSDVRMARRHGLTAYHYRKCLDRALRSPGLRKAQRRALKAHRRDARRSIHLGTVLTRYAIPENMQQDSVQEDFWYELGYRQVGLLFLGFCRWLIHQALTDRVEKLYFLSRDGFILKQVYDLLSQKIEHAPPSVYLYASRRALNVPGITELDAPTMDFLVGGTSTLRVEQFIGRLGLRATDFAAEIRAAGFDDATHRVVNGRDYAMLRDLYQRIFPAIRQVALAEQEHLYDYLQTTGILQAGKIGLVDIGWHGTLQHSLNRLIEATGRSIDITGYYLGTFQKARLFAEAGQRMASYICKQAEPVELYDKVKLSVEIFEFIHMAPHGSVIKFEQTEQGIAPVFEVNDQDPAKLAKVAAVQQGALDFVSDSAHAWRELGFLELSPELAIEPLADLLAKPTHREAVLLGDLEHAEGFGDVYVKRHIARPPEWLHILINPLGLASGYRRAFWRRGYLKRLWSLKDSR